MNTMHIPENEHADVLGSFWAMLRECEDKAERNNDPVLKLWVEKWYEQISRIIGKNMKPEWVSRSNE